MNSILVAKVFCDKNVVREKETRTQKQK